MRLREKKVKIKLRDKVDKNGEGRRGRKGEER